MATMTRASVTVANARHGPSSATTTTKTRADEVARMRSRAPLRARATARAVSDAGDWRCPLRGCDVGDLRTKRLITAVKTPYLESGKVDLYAYLSLIHI